jgi:hypothetical protein
VPPVRVTCCLLVAVLTGVAACQPHRPAPRAGVPVRDSRVFVPERMRRAVDGRPLPEVRTKVAGVWKFRVTVAGSVQELSVGHFADRGDPASVTRTGVICVRLPADAGPGQTWEVEAEFDFDQPILWEKGLLVWRFAKPVSAVRAG